MLRITVPLQTDERDALINLAQRERRDPRDQAAVLIRHELIERGLLAADIPMPNTVQPIPQAAPSGNR